MDITFLNDYVVLVVVVLNIWIAKGISPNILLAGMFSGLASTGLHQLFKTLINKEGEK